MNTWVPPQLKSGKEYVRFVTISSFVVFMLWLVSLFYDEYNEAKANKKHAETNIAIIQENTQSVPPPPPGNPVKITGMNEPIGGGAAPPPPPPQAPTPSRASPKEAIDSIPNIKVEGSDSKIEIDAWIVKVAMSNEASWMAIMKMIFTVLFTFFGIRLINFGFKKLEGPSPT